MYIKVEANNYLIAKSSTLFHLRIYLSNIYTTKLDYRCIEFTRPISPTE